jgi:PhnB protein
MPRKGGDHDVNSPCSKSSLSRLIVRDADAAIRLCRNALGAELTERVAEPVGMGVLCPMSLGGTVLIQLEFENCDTVAEQMIAERAEVVVPIKGRPYGKCEGRIRGPFGQLWILSQQVAG